MSKKAQRKKTERLYTSLVDISTRSRAAGADLDERGDDDAGEWVAPHADASVPVEVLARSAALSKIVADETEKPRKLLLMKKFRFQLLHQWLTEHFEPCRVADIGGGKGLLAYLLQQSGWHATVIDPVYQTLPTKYKDIVLGRRVKIPPTDSVPRITGAFEIEMAQNFDLLIGVHAHGCNIKILEAVAAYRCACLLMPCCVINEPVCPPLGVHWLECVIYYAALKGQPVDTFRLPFKGQNIGFVTPGGLKLRAKV